MLVYIHTNPTTITANGNVLLFRCKNDKLLHNTVQGNDVIFGDYDCSRGFGEYNTIELKIDNESNYVKTSQENNISIFCRDNKLLHNTVQGNDVYLGYSECEDNTLLPYSNVYQLFHSGNGYTETKNDNIILMRCENDKLLHTTVQGNSVYMGYHDCSDENSFDESQGIIIDNAFTANKNIDHTYVEMFENETFNLIGEIIDYGNPVDLSTIEISGAVHNHTTNLHIVDLDIAPIDSAHGVFKYGLSKEKSKLLNVKQCIHEKYEFYIQVKYSNGMVNIPINGFIIVSDEPDV